MWWIAVFWLLLIPLIVVEVIIFVKTKRLFWLLYALSVFVYVVAVSYTLDVFDAGRNAVIITLLASSALMVVVGRHLGKVRGEQRSTASRAMRWAAIGIVAVMAVLFVVSALAGRAQERLEPVASIAASDALVVNTDEGAQVPVGGRDEKPLRLGERRITVLTRHLSNDFILPVPAQQRWYRACLVTSKGQLEIHMEPDYRAHLEVPARGNLVQEVRMPAAFISEDEAQGIEVEELHVYVGDLEGQMQFSLARCEEITVAPDFVIPVEE